MQIQPEGWGQAIWKRRNREFPRSQATGTHHLQFAHLLRAVTLFFSSPLLCTLSPSLQLLAAVHPYLLTSLLCTLSPLPLLVVAIFRLIRAAIRAVFDGLRQATAAQGGRAGAELDRDGAVVGAKGGGIPQPRSSASPAAARGVGDRGSSSSPYSTMTLQLLSIPIDFPPIK